MGGRATGERPINAQAKAAPADAAPAGLRALEALPGRGSPLWWAEEKRWRQGEVTLFSSQGLVVKLWKRAT
jgi:hypothetical protein